jgi:hypothetical protein
MKKKSMVYGSIVVVSCAMSLGAEVPSFGQDSTKLIPAAPQTAAVVAEGEELVYEVSYAFIKLGTVRLQTFPNYRVRAYIDSYTGQPFVDIHSMSETEMDSSFFSGGSWGIEKKGDSWYGLNYLHDPGDERLFVEETYQKDVQSLPHERQIVDTLLLSSGSILDGLCTVYYPRAMLHSAQSVDVPTILYGKLGTTTFHFARTPVTEPIAALDDPVRVIEVDGKLSMEGIFGLTGDFTAWFSDDSTAVPIKANVKVLIGNVTVELIQWKRAGWRPPH